MINPFKRKPPTVYTQPFNGRPFTHVTGRNKKGYNMCFQYFKPDEFIRAVHNSYVDYCFTTSRDIISFWSREDIKHVVIHAIPDEH